MNLRECGYEIELEKDKINNFEEKMLFSGLCDFAIPMMFSEKGDKKKITYDCSGYIALDDIQLENSKQVFEILEKTLLTLSKSIEFFIPPSKITLNKETVYYNPKQKNIKIAYIPQENKTLQESVSEFIDELTFDANNETVEYLDNVKADIYFQNRNIKEMASFVNEQRKIIYQCGA